MIRGAAVADIIERDGRWHVTVAGAASSLTEKSFSTPGRAKAWATRYEAAIDRYGPSASRMSGDPLTTSLGDLLERYNREVSSRKRGAKSENYRIGRMRQSALAELMIGELTSQALAEYRDERLRVTSNSTVRIELSVIRRTIETARREWGFALPENVAQMVTSPAPDPARTRRLLDQEYEKLEIALRGHPLAWAVVRFAIETAMRQGEILTIRWRHVDLHHRMVHLPYTKNGTPRTVPLTDGAVEVLEGLKATGERVFPIDKSALRHVWVKAVDTAGIKDLRFHDLRREGCSRLFEMGLSVPEIALISGHRTVSMLFRYTHLLPLELAKKLKGRKRQTE